jgi:hypothetical protein
MRMETEEAAILNKRERVLGRDAGQYYHHLWRQLVLMHVTLAELRLLLKVRKGEVRVPSVLVNQFFKRVWASFGRDLIHGISALADPAKMQQFSNVSFEGLMTTLGRHGVVSCEYKQALVAFKEAAAPVEAHRNKRLAHFDAEVILNRKATEVNATLDEIEVCLKRAGEVMNAVEREYFQNSKVVYEDPWVPSGGLGTLISMLPKGD